MADRVELIVQLMGDRDALNSLKNLQNTVNDLNRRRIEIRVDKNDLDRRISEVRKAIENLTRVRYEMNLRGDNLDEIDKQIRDLRDTLRDLTQERRSLTIDGSDVAATIAGLRADQQDYNRVIDETIAKYDEMVDSINAVASVMQTFSSISGGIASFANGIADSFSGMASMFDTNIVDTIERYLTVLATRNIVGDFGKITSRYDIMRTFSDYMDLAGVAADESEKALQRVNQAILGLPIGLDESAQRLRRYQMFLGDINRATNLTIGLQNALYAGGANEQMRTAALYQIDRLLSAGKLSNARQWYALIQGLGVSIRFIAQELGVDQQSLPSMLSSGAISAQEFLAALERLGTGSTEAAQGLENALDIYKGTLESWLSNIQFAAVRGGETFLKAVNDVLDAQTGKGITGYLADVRGAINDFYKGVDAWTRGNPQTITAIFSSVQNLMDSVSRFDGSRIVTGIFDNLAKGLDLVSTALNALPKGTMEDFIAFATTIAGPLGAFLKMVSSGAGVVLGVFQRFRSFDFAGLIEKVVRQIQAMADVVDGLLSMIPDGLMGDLMAFGLVWGMPLAKVIGAIGTALTTVAGAMAALKAGNIAGNGLAGLITLVSAHPAIAAAAAAVVALAGGLVLLSAHNAKIRRNLYDELGIREIEQAVSAAQSAIKSTESTIDSYAQKVTELQATHEIAAKYINEAFDLSNAGDSASLALLSQRIEQINQIVPGLKLSLDEATGRLTDAGTAARNSALEFNDLYTAAKKAQLAIDYIADLQSSETQLLIQQRALQLKLVDLVDAEKEAEAAWLDSVGKGAGSTELATTLSLRRNARIETEDSLEKIEDQLKDVGYQTQAAEEIIGENQEAWEQLNDTLEDTTTAMEDVADASEVMLTRTGKNLESLQQAYADLLEEAQKWASNNIKMFEEVETSAKTSIEKMNGILEHNLEVYRNYNSNLAGLISMALQNPEMMSMTGYFIEGGLDTAGELDAFLRASDEQQAEYIRNFNFTLTEQAIMEQMYEAYYLALQEGATVSDLEDLGYFSQSLLAKFKDPILKPSDIRELEAAGVEVDRQVTDAVSSHLGDTKPDAQPIADNLAQSIKETDMSPAVEAVEEQIKPVTEAIEGAVESITGDESITAAMGTLVGAMAVVTEEATPEMIDAFDEENDMMNVVLETLTALIGSIEDYTEATEDATDATEDFTKELKNLSREASTADSRMYALASTIANLAMEAELAAVQVSMLADAINGLQDKTVHIGVETAEISGGGVSSIGRGGGIGGPIAVPYANGGVVYRAGGGNLWKARGTDIVPAMLTPGEFVLNRNAVSRLGTGILDALNRMDFAGAMSSLMMRFYRPTPMYGVVNTRYDNRRYSVNQTIHTNNPQYTHRIASRFVHSL